MEKEESIGALWKKSGAKGDYFIGTISINGVATRIVVFPNTLKKNENEPDFRILKARPRVEDKVGDDSNVF